ncbi:MAG: VWA domain-containing protein [Acidobacteria bacterium]|nr:VWA domain-containing protein [Acidobacteriota bacterium]
MTKHKPSHIRRAMGLLLLALVPLLFFASNRPARAQDDDVEVVRVNTDIVVLNVTVVDAAGKFVHGLHGSDFKLLVDGKEQPISNFMREETPFAAAVLLDSSGSMEERMMLARSAALRFLEELREDDMAAVYRFDSEIKQVQEFSPSRDLGEFAFDIRARGMTALNDAVLRAAKDLGQRQENRRAIIVLSDGADTKSASSANKALDTALAVNATIYTVDMSSVTGATSRSQQNAAVLQNFAAKTGGRYVATPGGPVMREAFTQIAEELSNQYTLTYAPPDSARDGRWHKLEVKLSRPELNVRTRKGYQAPKK